jgi:hypothetical protein
LESKIDGLDKQNCRIHTWPEQSALIGAAVLRLMPRKLVLEKHEPQFRAAQISRDYF